VTDGGVTSNGRQWVGCKYVEIPQILTRLSISTIPPSLQFTVL